MKSRLLVAVALCAGLACNDTTDPGGAGVDGFDVTVPTTAIAGEPFSVTIQARGDNVGSFGEPVALSVASGEVSPSSVTLANGQAELDVAITGVAGTVTLLVTADRAQGEGTIHSLLARTLPGDDEDMAADRTPRIPYEVREEDFSDDHPDVPGVVISHNTLLVLPAPDVTVGVLNTLLTDLDALVVGAIPGRSGVAGGPLVLRIPVDDHTALDAVVTSLRANPAIAAVAPDVTIAPALEPAPQTNVPNPPGWVWASPPGGGNWGMETSRAPQMWNLHPALTKRGAVVPTGVVDTGFDGSHPDLSFQRNLTPAIVDTHGTHVAGTIGATFSNGQGVDGMNPFAQMTVTALGFDRFDRFVGRLSWGNVMYDGLESLILNVSGLQVVNMSLGYNWGHPCGNVNPCPGYDTNTSVFARTVASNHGFIFDAFLRLQDLAGDVPIVVVAAGNDSNDGFGTQDARWASPMCNAALEHGNPHIIVVEAVDDAPAQTGAATRAAFSNINGHISAPGVGINSTIPGRAFKPLNGTSMATPHVTGLVGYLLALDPTLEVGNVRTILDGSAIGVAGGASARIDAYGAVLELDRLRGNDSVLRMLCDIDDGSVDGNTRVDLTTGASVTSLDLDGDTGLGDGTVDMSDFRRWRDWLLQVETPSGLSLDGAANHIKRDIDGDGQPNEGANENLYPQGDFNGDGKLSRTDAVFVPGALGQVMTDLAVFETVFQDPDYAAADLAGLLTSADLHVSADSCFADPRVVTMRSRVEGPAGIVGQRTHDSQDPIHIYTLAVPAAGYTAVVEGLDAAGDLVTRTEQTFTLAPGEDVLWSPDCSSIVIEAQLPTVMVPGDPVPFLVRAGVVTAAGDTTFIDGIRIDLLAVGGSATPPTGVTDLAGHFESEVTMDDTATTIDVFVTATTPAGQERTIVVSSVSRPPDSVTRRQDFVHVRICDPEGCEGPDNFLSTELLGPVTGTRSHTMSRGGGQMEGTARLSSDVVFDGPDIMTVRVEGSALADSRNEGDTPMTTRAKSEVVLTVVVRREVGFDIDVETHAEGPSQYTPFGRVRFVGGAGPNAIVVFSENGSTEGPTSGTLSTTSLTITAIADVGFFRSQSTMTGVFTAAADFSFTITLFTLDGSPIAGAGDLEPAVEVVRVR